MAESTADKARKARRRAFDQDYPRGASRGGTDRLVMDLTRGKEKLIDKFGGRYANESEQRAANLMQQRRRLDTAKTAARATAIEKRTAAKKAEKTLMTGATGGAAKKQAPKSATNKATEKMKSTPKVKITGTASSKPQVSGSMSKSQPKTTTKPKTIGTGPNKAKVTPMPPAKKSAKGLPTTGRQNVKKKTK